MAIICHSKSCNTYTINFTILWKICLHLLLCYPKVRVCQHNVISKALPIFKYWKTNILGFGHLCGFPPSLLSSLLNNRPTSVLPRRVFSHEAVAVSRCICMLGPCVRVQFCFLLSRSGVAALIPEEAFLVCTSMSNTCDPAFQPRTSLMVRRS